MLVVSGVGVSLGGYTRVSVSPRQTKNSVTQNEKLALGKGRGPLTVRATVHDLRVRLTGSAGVWVPSRKFPTLSLRVGRSRFVPRCRLLWLPRPDPPVSFEAPLHRTFDSRSGPFSALFGGSDFVPVQSSRRAPDVRHVSGSWTGLSDTRPRTGSVRDLRCRPKLKEDTSLDVSSKVAPSEH